MWAGMFLCQACSQFWTEKLQIGCGDFFQYPPKGYESEFRETTLTRDETKGAFLDNLEVLIGMLKGERTDLSISSVVTYGAKLTRCNDLRTATIKGAELGLHIGSSRHEGGQDTFMRAIFVEW